jgi:enterochelin esterase family protein
MLSLLLTAVNGQPPAAPTVVSPEVHPDRTVTFRIAAPKAAEVTLTTDWLPTNATQKMEKSPDGVWSVTVGPLASTGYIYTFNVDGVAMADPVNPLIKLRARGSGSIVEVPAATPSVWDLQAVPHGTVEINCQQSKVLGGEPRQVFVYTPPGYAQSPDRRYPVLYLLHGNNDTTAGWTTAGHANLILDNLLAQDRAVPMIVVMPFGHALPYGTRTAADGRSNTQVFEDYLLHDVMPLVEARYRVAAGREQCAIAGLSMGGDQASHIFFKNLDRFSALGAFSPAGLPNLAADYPSLLNDPAGTNARIAVLWLACGRQDQNVTFFPNTERFAGLLTAHQINHVWNPTEGFHNFSTWRQNLADFAPLLFRAATAAVDVRTPRRK